MKLKITLDQLNRELREPRERELWWRFCEKEWQKELREALEQHREELPNDDHPITASDYCASLQQLLSMLDEVYSLEIQRGSSLGGNWSVLGRARRHGLVDFHLRDRELIDCLFTAMLGCIRGSLTRRFHLV